MGCGMSKRDGGGKRRKDSSAWVPSSGKPPRWATIGPPLSGQPATRGGGGESQDNHRPGVVACRPRPTSYAPTGTSFTEEDWNVLTLAGGHSGDFARRAGKPDAEAAAAAEAERRRRPRGGAVSRQPAVKKRRRPDRCPKRLPAIPEV
ncbi:hypothetical protein GGTG_04047 [Gaeumannomyces tritici R3-111a-1]|uniref:Uncharacterized protein n=1 Tax=Gaeumannomyces tritici (strain R3-111a-1) TaxID=644352 RepID=J3NRZ9_GAET3|nr:hypothetical protein GGTG_04047 [Gaeumannomyces tritici R3-111a-1]EJT78955.1 hypothetical protein GGTG_04047 [Gaeumannomyces tritici R3-111a-1]